MCPSRTRMANPELWGVCTPVCLSHFLPAFARSFSLCLPGRRAGCRVGRVILGGPSGGWPWSPPALSWWLTPGPRTFLGWCSALLVWSLPRAGIRSVPDSLCVLARGDEGQARLITGEGGQGAQAASAVGTAVQL